MPRGKVCGRPGQLPKQDVNWSQECRASGNSELGLMVG